MKTYLAAALMAALAQPAAAVTFPSLTTIYVASGVHDDSGGGSASSATAVHCTNVSGVSAQLRVLVLHNSGSVAGAATANVAHGATATFVTHAIFIYAATALNTGAVQQGALNIESTQSAVFCSAMEMSADAISPQGVALHMVRVNPHPGTVE